MIQPTPNTVIVYPPRGGQPTTIVQPSPAILTVRNK
jgi:hypothetical protein